MLSSVCLSLAPRLVYFLCSLAAFACILFAACSTVYFFFQAVSFIKTATPDLREQFSVCMGRRPGAGVGYFGFIEAELVSSVSVTEGDTTRFDSTRIGLGCVWNVEV